MVEARPVDTVFRTGLSLYRRRFIPLFLLFFSVSLLVLLPGASLVWVLAGGHLTSPAIFLHLGSHLLREPIAAPGWGLALFGGGLLLISLLAGVLYLGALLLASAVAKADLQEASVSLPSVLNDLWGMREHLLGATLRGWAVLMLAFFLVGIPGVHLAVLAMLAFPAAARAGMPPPSYTGAGSDQRTTVLLILMVVVIAGILVGTAGGASRHVGPLELALLQSIANGLVLPLYPTLLAAAHEHFGTPAPRVVIASETAQGRPGSGHAVP